MQHDPHLPLHRPPHLLQPLEIQPPPRPPRSVRAVHVPKRRRQEIDARVHELHSLLGRRQHALQVRRVRQAVLAALDAPGLGLRRDAPRVAVRRQLARQTQVLGARVVRHVHHDGVEAAQRRRVLDELDVQAVVEVQRDGHGGGRAHVGGEAREVRFELRQGPGEEQDHGGRAAGLGGAGDGDDFFEVVLEGELESIKV